MQNDQMSSSEYAESENHRISRGDFGWQCLTNIPLEFVLLVALLPRNMPWDEVATDAPQLGVRLLLSGRPQSDQKIALPKNQSAKGLPLFSVLWLSKNKATC